MEMSKTFGEYEMTRLLQLGADGTICEVINQKTNAFHKLFQQEETEQTQKQKDESAQLRKELKILSELEHPNIIKIIDCFRTTLDDTCVITEHAKGGDLRSKVNHQISIQQKLYWFAQMCLAVDFIHKVEIIHRDLKPESIFLDERGVIKVGNFGIQKILRKSVGTSLYAAPEVFSIFPKYSSKSDVFSLGVILYELLSGQHPFRGYAPHVVARNIMRKQSKELPNIPAEMNQLLGQMLQKKPEERPTIQEILTNPLVEPHVLLCVAEGLEVQDQVERKRCKLSDKEDKKLCSIPSKEILSSNTKAFQQTKVGLPNGRESSDLFLGRIPCDQKLLIEPKNHVKFVPKQEKPNNISKKKKKNPKRLKECE